jgi:hypothetical protein
MSQAGAVDQGLYRYLAFDGSNAAWEDGVGTWTLITNTLVRSPTASSAGGGLVTLTAAAQVFMTASAAEMAALGINCVPISDANYAFAPAVYQVALTALTATRTITAPSAASFPRGRMGAVYDESGNCSQTIQIIVTANGSDLISGAASQAIVTAYGSLKFVSNGSNKLTVI